MKFTNFASLADNQDNNLLDSSNAPNPEAQEKFNRLFRELGAGGILEPEKFMATVRTGLEAGGFDLKNPDSIDRMENSIVGPIFEQKKAEEKELIDEYKRVLRDEGATDVQLAWGL